MTTIILDDRDPKISYKGQWLPGGIRDLEYAATTTGSNTLGDLASFTFTGTKISVWGTVDNNLTGRVAPTSAYFVDNPSLPLSTFLPTMQTNALHLHNFFQSDELSPTSHTLFIKNIGSNSNSYIWIDYILITPSDSNKLPVGLIVGAILGGFGFFAILVVAVVLFLRKKGRQYNKLTVPNNLSESSLSSQIADSQPPQYQSFTVDSSLAYPRDHLPSSKIEHITVSSPSNLT
ncbi:hypothetical protein GALMADRAFT_139460 [Galerina marginata CBS 339.88]|uniref:Uncharacterized protein n=1 Tax=Galerina marginata (strain CBS 339.88) TaxID=685588 RepID=A0A067TC33_GALM3|nr:hypothetical protein GALMADRAFT_139460 [Galerina marginata CBS 339.88]